MASQSNLWTERHWAKLILASCAKNPPPLDSFNQFFGLTSDRWSAFAGPRARKLEQIREKHLCELSGADWDAADPDAAACKRYLELNKTQPTVTEAIDAAIGKRSVRAHEYDVGIVGRPARTA